ncbi:uracil-DNA glycosylase family protein [Methylophilus medardicus]|uniref:Uracil-DNA glycosylase-like domain-containing protein n=1 Tax=Methylophilus medardicus TaxID=2588534 RepID=A0A5B8CUU1_9PROT|nr:DNA polymerase III subunit psi [Methylophilus medardicus]QDC44826.1 hypothetical protein FIU01_10050 [Methylophilus medardicus]QDC49833.1 hypothetical protein FIU00_10050 [Methylophilus medardicus]QDC53538.1 hypothetical protein FIT99_10050 [Methylophilus medardicus]
MHLTREDMLRELDLLPVWRARMPATEPLQTMPLAVPVVSEVVATMDEQSVALTAEGLNTPVPFAPAEAPAAPVASYREAPATALELPTEVLAVSSDVPTANVTTAPLLQSPWLLCCPPTADAASHTLLHNIVRALALPADQVTIHTETIGANQVQASFCVLFGLEAANAFLGTQHTELASIRGRLLNVGSMWLVVTHPPLAILQNQLLKREVWQDLCLLLAKNTAVPA